MKKTKTKGLLNMGCQIHKVKTKYNRKNHVNIDFEEEWAKNPANPLHYSKVQSLTLG